MKADQERLKRLLTETVKVFLNDNVPCHNVTSVEGLIGTLDNSRLRKRIMLWFGWMHSNR